MKKKLLLIVTILTCCLWILAGCSSAEQKEVSDMSTEGSSFEAMDVEEDVTIDLDEDEDYVIQ